MVNFLVFWGILFLVAFKPFARRIRQREQEEERWRAELARVSQLEEEATEARESALAQALKERDALLRSSEELDERYVQDGIQRSRKAAQAQLKRAREQIHRQISQAYQDLHDSFVELVLGAAERALGRSLNQEEHQQLIQKAIQELSNFNGSLRLTGPSGSR
jgi:F-type H+-transporting ATPase subunit b